MKKGIIINLLSFAVVLFGCGSTASDTAKAPSADTVVSSEAESTQKIPVHVATAGGPAPYVTVEKDGTVSGYDIEVLRSAFALLPKYEPDFQLTEFSSIFTGLTSGNFDIAANFLSYNEDRAKSYLYSYPYEKSQYVFYTGKNVGKVTSFADLAGKSIESTSGLSTATAIEAWNAKNPDKAIKIDYTDADITQQFTDVATGKYDFGISDTITSAIYTDKNGDFKFDLNVYPMSDEAAAAIAPNAYAYYLLGPDDKQLREDLDGALKELKKNGTLQKLSKKYLEADYTPETSQYEKTIN